MQKMEMTVGRLAQAAGAIADPSVAGRRVRGVCYDSRRAAPGDLFVALRGLRADGADFAADAVARGAVAVLSGSGAPADWGGRVPWIRVPDDRLALARVSCEFFGHPSRRLFLAGITGTNGKTSTAWILESILARAGRPAGLLGTVVYRWPGYSEEAPRTTPESPDINRDLVRILEAGCTAAVMEVSSHALALRRTDGLDFDAAIFTNLTRDHLDYHRSFPEYFDAKARLFEGLSPAALAVVNADDPKGPDLLRRSGGRKVTYGSAPTCDLQVTEVVATAGGLELVLRDRARGALPIRSPLLGRVMASNIAAAALCALECGIEPEIVRAGVEAVRVVPGRLHRIDEGQPFTVLVDYAHTDDALRNLLLSVREWRPARVIVVFGCGGDRDREKRPLMGAIAAKHADVVVATSDNPRSEDPLAILDQVLKGIAEREGLEVHVEPDRRHALDLALSLARPGDLVVAAGKGHERTQEVQGVRRPFDDREVLQELLAERRAAGQWGGSGHRRSGNGRSPGGGKAARPT